MERLTTCSTSQLDSTWLLYVTVYARVSNHWTTAQTSSNCARYITRTHDSGGIIAWEYRDFQLSRLQLTGMVGYSRRTAHMSINNAYASKSHQSFLCAFLY